MAEPRPKYELLLASSLAAGFIAYALIKHFKKAEKPAGPAKPAEEAITPEARNPFRSLVKAISGTKEFAFISSTTGRPTRLTVPDTLQAAECFPNPMMGNGDERSLTGSAFMPSSVFNIIGGYVLGQHVFREGEDHPNDAIKFILGDPRREIIFLPKNVKVGIATCGGLCPGLNVVIRELVMTLHYNYGVPEIYGIKSGYRGFYTQGNIIRLTPEMVTDYHTLGGTVLKSSRGGFNADKICDSVQSMGFNMLFILGGDGTHRGIMALSECFKKRGVEIAIVGVPKTIDNDIPLIDKSFGFETAVEEAQRAIQSANVEANSADFGVGLVKLMGRNSGFIAMNATIASRDVNVCLIPEVPYEIKRVVEYVHRRLMHKNHCVIVVAEGAASACVDQRLVKEGTDPSGNPLLFDIGSHLKTEIVGYCKTQGMECTLKYIDPTYMIRTVPANSHDVALCVQLAQAAVHGAFAGYTAFTVGTIGSNPVLIPVQTITQAREGKNAALGQRRVDPEHDLMWWRLMASTGQPNFSPA